MEITDSVALVTGANRGIGRQFARQLVERGARKVYATARRPELIDIPGVEALRLDITDPGSVVEAAAIAQDVTLLVNNAGIASTDDLISGDLATIRQEMETNFFGTLAVVRAFAPVLGTNGGGAILTVLSALSWTSYPGSGSYSASKAAEWSLSNGMRLELAKQGTLVTALHLGAADTDMMRDKGYDGPLLDPADAVRDALDGVEAGAGEVLADDTARFVKASLAKDPSELVIS